MKDKWLNKLPDGRSVIYTYETEARGHTSATAEIEASHILHIRENLSSGMSHQEVEMLFRNELDLANRSVGRRRVDYA